MKLRAKVNIEHDGETCVAGETLPEITDRQAQALIDVGAAEAIEAPAEGTEPPADKKKPAPKA